MSDARGVPSAADLVEAVREFLENEVMTTDDRRLAFHGRVAAYALAQVERELALGPEHAAAHAERLAALGVADDAALAAAIRAGELDGREAELVAALRATAAEKLRIANPRHLRDDDRKP